MIAGNEFLAWRAWTIPALIVGIWLPWSIVRDLLDHEAGVDIIALLAIGGALLLGESLAAAVIAVMLATGEPSSAMRPARARQSRALGAPRQGAAGCQPLPRRRTSARPDRRRS